MEVASFLKKLTKKPSPNIGCFLAVQIDTEFIKTAIWEIKNDLPEIIGIGGTAQWDGTSVEVLLEAIDTSLSVALEKIPEKVEISKAIFGLPEAWVSPESILPARLNDIKTICDKMAFKPLGFVITTEAIAQYLKAKEGTPASAILVRISTSEVAVSIIRLGVIEATHIAGRSGDISSDVKEGLTRFGDQESLPSRIILYDGTSDKLDELTQQLLVSDWYSSFPFLHIPKIETMDNSFSISAIAISGGGEAAKSLGIPVKPIPLQEPAVETKPEMQPEIKPDTKTEQPKSIPKPEAKHSAAIPNINLNKVKELFSKFKSLKVPTPPLPKIQVGINKTNLTIAAVFLFFLLITVGSVQMAKKLVKTTLKISISGQDISNTVQAIADPESKSIDSDTNILPAQIVTLIKSKEKTKPTTGKKTTGDRAKGEIVIYNLRTDGNKGFDEGSAISATVNGSKTLFTLDTSVTVNPATPGNNYIIVPGNAKVSVTSESFGPEYNLESGIEFQIANYSKSTYVAKNEAAFTGGTKKEIAMISKKDRSDLLANLTEEIKSEAKDELISQNQDKKIFVDSIEVKPTKENYSGDAGTEAESVSLSLEAQVKAIAVTETDYQNLLASILSSKAPAGFSANGQNVKSEINNIKIDEGKVYFDLNFSAILTPQTDKNQLLQMIAGKRPAEAMDVLKRLPRVKNAEIIFSPKLPGFLQWISNDPSRVDFEIQI
ncbi:hypothetical protein HZB78_01600 [Candidatus Collierbacteria bacterium]|nr:hypothetical protein [Candidatus Collierbacteria bacterium]